MTATTIDLLDVDRDAVDVVTRSPGARPEREAPWTSEELLRWWRQRNYRDASTGPRLDWHDEIERVAIASHLRSWNPPEAVGSMVAAESSRDAMAELWAAMRPERRQLLRRRALLVLVLSVAARDHAVKPVHTTR
jgi:hypothetical protein